MNSRPRETARTGGRDVARVLLLTVSHPAAELLDCSLLLLRRDADSSRHVLHLLKHRSGARGRLAGFLGSSPTHLAHLTGALRHVPGALLTTPDMLRDVAVALRLDAFPLDDDTLPLVVSATLFPSVPQALADPASLLGPPAMQLRILTAALRSRAGALSLLTVLFPGHKSSAGTMARPKMEMLRGCVGGGMTRGHKPPTSWMWGRAVLCPRPLTLSVVAGAPIAPVQLAVEADLSAEGAASRVAASLTGKRNQEAAAQAALAREGIRRA
ncbi:MAG: hypothetical protein M3Q93_02610 [Gemmatimonadota bacterium]|nr:hypothetical protein [Gemmatimonadota bacterium]